MAEGGFYEQKRLSPTGLAVVVAMHAAGLGALILAKNPVFITPERPDTEVTFVPLPDPPDREPEPQPQPRNEPQRARTRIDTPPPVIPTPTRGPVIDTAPIPPQAWNNTPPGNDIVLQPQPQPEPPPPPAPPRVVEAARARGSLQGLFRTDDYPTAAAEAGEQGTAAVRLNVGADGRVTDCSVTRSTGSRALDRITCSVLRARARYTPARDQNNQPVSDTQTATIIWRLTD